MDTEREAGTRNRKRRKREAAKIEEETDNKEKRNCIANNFLLCIPQ
jgi:hypothetical protein